MGTLTDHHQQAGDGNFKMKTFKQFSQSLMRHSVSQTNIVLLINDDVLAILYYEINTSKCVLHISVGYSVICLSLITGTGNL